MSSETEDDKLEEKEISKTSAKRKYLLTDEDLEDVDFEMRDNPLNKSYAPMKVFKKSKIEKAAIAKWGSLEKLHEEKQMRKDRNSSLVEKKEKEMRKLWDCEDIYEPMKMFMDKIEIPKKKISPEFEDKGNKKDLLKHDVILCYCDCMHSRPPGAQGKSVYKAFPSASKVDKSTPYNDRRKLGHYSWIMDKSQLIVNIYVVYKWSFRSTQAAIPILNSDALALGLRRLSAALSNEWKKQSGDDFGLRIGTYVPYQEDPEQFKTTVQESFTLPLIVVSYADFKSSTE